MRPDQHLLGQILGQGAVAGEHRGEPQHTGSRSAANSSKVITPPPSGSAP
jgi:hypothetical protein